MTTVTETCVPKIIKTVNHLHPVSFNSGPRIEMTQTIQYGDITVEVNFWYENGRLVKVI